MPLFEFGSSNRRLGPKDARFVDIIHTDGGILGNPEAMGHADFYPNGGRALQPGCARQEIANNRWLGILSEFFLHTFFRQRQQCQCRRVAQIEMNFNENAWLVYVRVLPSNFIFCLFSS